MAFYHILSRFFGTFFPLEEKCAVRICEGKLKVITWRKMLFVPQCENLWNFLPLWLYLKTFSGLPQKPISCQILERVWVEWWQINSYIFTLCFTYYCPTIVYALSHYIESLLYFGRKEAVFFSPIRRHASSDLLNYAYVIEPISLQWAKSAIYCYTVVK